MNTDIHRGGERLFSALYIYALIRHRQCGELWSLGFGEWKTAITALRYREWLFT